MNKQNIKNSKGITLVALIITIVVLLILAIVSIGEIKDSGIIAHAQNAVTDYNAKQKEENELLQDYVSEIESNLPGDGEDKEENKDQEQEEKEEEKEAIPTTTTYIGYYADVDGNGSVDGIIYADLAVDASGQWTDGYGAYSYSKKETLNNYYISQEKYKYKNFEEKPVIAPIGKVEENDRFYVMALEDFNPGTYYRWYNSAYTFEGQMKDYQTDTSVLFEKGKENTSNMIGFWKAGKYGTGDTGSYKDIWGQINAKVAEGWFVPSRGEWGAFGDMATKQGMTETNYADYGLSGSSLSSSQYGTSSAWFACFSRGYMDGLNVNIGCYVRLSTTF